LDVDQGQGFDQVGRSYQLLLARENCLTNDEFGLEQGRPISPVEWASGTRVSSAPFDKLTARE
jgi:hypothetical protein